MLRDRLRSNRRICRIDFSAFAAILVALATLLAWGTPADYHPHGPFVNLPKTANEISLWGARREDALQVVIPRDGKIFFGARQVSAEELPVMLRQGVRNGAPKKVYIRADARVRYRTVIAVLDGIRSARLSDIAFVTH